MVDGSVRHQEPRAIPDVQRSSLGRSDVVISFRSSEFATTCCKNAGALRPIWLSLSAIGSPIFPLPSQGWIVTNIGGAIAAFKSGSCCSLPSNHSCETSHLVLDSEALVRHSDLVASDGPTHLHRLTVVSQAPTEIYRRSCGLREKIRMPIDRRSLVSGSLNFASRPPSSPRHH